MKEKTDIDWDKAVKIFTPEKEGLIKELVGKLDEYPRAKTILILLAAGGALGISMVSPAAPLTFYSLVRVWKSFSQPRLKQTIKRLRQQKYVEVREENGKYVVKITTKGLTRALSYKLEDLKIKEPKEWDGKWRIIVFDISDKKKRHREIFRERIKSLGLYPFQESIYVYPYPCFDQVEFLRQIFGVGVEVKYILAEKIEDDEELKNYFQL